MARKRMIDPSIWQDEEFGSLVTPAKLLFIAMFSNADDEGRLRANPAYLKSIGFMYDDSFSLVHVKSFRDEISEKMKSVRLYVVDGKEYIQLSNWDEYQKQHKDRIVSSTLPPFEDDVSDNVGQVTDNVGLSKDKISKVKLDQVKLSKGTSHSKIDDLTEFDFQEIATDYQTTLPHVLSCLDDLRNYCDRTGKTYKDYKAALRNFVKKNVMERREHVAGKSKISFIDPK